MPHFALRHPPRCRRHPGSPNAGFALLITIVLMTFLVLIMVSFSALTRVEIQIAKNYQEQDSARQNALVALNIALGQLQKYAGPDQRTTATADLAAGSDTYTDFDGQTISRGETYSSTETAAATNATTDNGLVRPKAGARYWTGVWGNLNAPLSAYTSNPSPKLLTWLVSGNENAAFTSNQTSSTAFGQITAVTAPPTFTPATISGVTASTTATSGTVTFANGATGVLLMGPQTTGNFAKFRNKYDPTQQVVLDQPASFVAAPLVDIKAPAGSVVGLAASSTPTLGHYAWWVGDEGVKARINLSDTTTDLANSAYLNGFSTAIGSANDPAARQRLAGPARNALELITADANGNGSLSDLATPNADNTILTKVLQPVQLNFVKPTPSVATLAATKYRCHDITSYSSGVLADSLRGGLRQDLTYVLAQSSLPAPFSTQSLLDEYGSAPTFGPTWNRVKSHWDLSPNFQVAGDDFGKYTVRIGSKDAVQITPIITKLRFVSTASIERQTDGTYQLKGYGGVYLVLGNPYANNLFLDSTSTYKLRFKRSASTSGTLSMRVTITNPSSGSQTTHSIDLFNGSSGMYDNSLFTVLGGTIGGSLTGANPHSQDFLSVGSSLPRYFTINQLDYIKDPYTKGGGTTTSGPGLRLFAPSPAISVTPPALSQTFKVNMEWVVSGALAFDAVIEQGTGASAKVLTGIYNCALPATETPDMTGDQNWVGAAQAPDFKPSASPTADASFSNFTGQVAGGFTVVLNSPAHSLFQKDPAGLYYQGTADSNRMAASFTDAGGASGPSATFPYHGGFAIPDPSTQNPKLGFKYYLLDPAGGTYSYTMNAWGRRSSYNSNTTYPTYAHLPFAAANATTGDYPFYSLADLREVNLSGDNESWSVGHQPTYIFGNSYHNVFVPRGQVTNSMISRSGVNRGYYDMSYLLNTSLWDRYFFSALPQSGSGLTPLNRRLAVRSGSSSAADLRSAAAAKCLTTTGAFNINSTSPEAWRAVLGALNGVPAVGKLSTGAADLNVPETDGVSFPRYLGEDTNRKATGTTLSTYNSVRSSNGGSSVWTSGNGLNGTRYGPYNTHHRLTPTELTQLSEDVVREVRKRGPFLSLSQFVNRGLRSDDLGRTGALQAAIDVTRGTPASINSFYDNTVSNVPQPNTNSTEQQIAYSGSGFYAEPLDTSAPYSTGKNHHANRLKAMPGWVLQGDLLASLGSVISARSDTFIIRTYGDTQNPVTGTVSARAWCEAVVQRLPDYVNPADAAEVTPANLSQADNKKFGRRFVIVSFRWLSPSDI